MWKKILAIGIVLAFFACGFKIYGQQNEIRQWQERATKYQLENQRLQEQIASQDNGKKKQSVPVNFSYSDSTMDELERYELENKIRSLQSDLDYERTQSEYERTQREIDRNNFEMNRYDPNYSPY